MHRVLISGSLAVHSLVSLYYTYLMNTQTPRWDMTSIFSSLDGADFTAACEMCLKQITELENLLENNEKSDFFTVFDRYFTLFNECGAFLASLSSYTYCIYSTDTTNTKALNALSKIEEIAINFKQIELNFREFLQSNTEKLPDLLKNQPKYKNYSYILDEELFFKEKQMSPQLEKLAAELCRTGGSAWSRLQQQIISNLTHPVTGKTFNQIRNDAYDANEQVRKTAFEHEKELLRSSQIPIAAALNSIKGETITLNKRVSWESALAKSCAQSRLSQKTLTALISSIETSLPFWRDYLKTKAKLLGKTELPFYDLFAPLPEEKQSKIAHSDSLVSRIWTFDEARDYIVEKFSTFSPELGNFAADAFKNHWIDAEIRKGKTGGAFCIDFPHHKQTRVLSNFSGSFSDITTLAHELGHAYHQYCIQDLDYALIHYPMTLAETASNFCETVIQKDVMKNSGGFDKISMTEMHLQDSCQVLVDILSRFYFERSVFEKRAQGELSSGDFCELMLDAQEKTYGDALSEKHPYMWAVKSHYYSPELDFYNFPYAFGLLFSSALYGRFIAEGTSFAQTYKTLLKETGRLSCEQVCRNAGFDIENREFWDSGIALFNEELQSLKKYAFK